MSTPSVVLVHGAFADASGWAGIIRELQDAGVAVSAPPTPLRGLGSDAEALRAAVGAAEGPVLLVGHSYGGAVVSQAAADLPNVVGLVYLAAFGLDEGESLLSVQEPFAPSLLASTGRPSSYPAPGAAGGPDLFIPVAQFRETFCADLPSDVASVMAVSQRPLSIAAASEPLSGTPAWRVKPSWYLVSEHDRAINPDAERFMAERMGATTETIDASHVAFASRPVTVAAFISAALAKVS
jgi:pimeloyl-ACP methyl ester carboxylesterase